MDASIVSFAHFQNHAADSSFHNRASASMTSMRASAHDAGENIGEPRHAGNMRFACSVAAHAVVNSPLAGLPALRERPGNNPPRPIPPRFLRYADEQTVVALAAVLRAIDACGLHNECFDDWGVLAAPRFFGRAAGAATFAKFRECTLDAVSPHVIPQHSLHSISGMISIALGMHGPNFGIGGGPEALSEGLAVGMSFLESDTVPGLWLVLTQWMPEAIPDAAGKIGEDRVCWGVAMALTRGARRGCTLRLSDAPPIRRFDPASPPQSVQLPELAEFLRSSSNGERPASRSFPLPWGGCVELAMHQQQLLKAA